MEDKKRKFKRNLERDSKKDSESIPNQVEDRTTEGHFSKGQFL